MSSAPVKAMQAAGLKVGRVELRGGTVLIIPAGDEEVADDSNNSFDDHAGQMRGAMDNITRLDNAKAMRAMGAPLNTPVEERRFSPRAAKKIDDVMLATKKFGKAVERWVKQNQKNYKAVWRAWEKLAIALDRAGSEPRWIEQPDGSSELANAEDMAVNVFIRSFDIVCSQWDEILTALENGEEQEIIVGKAPWPLGPFPKDDIVIHGGGGEAA
jgi:hypothetical protein